MAFHWGPRPVYIASTAITLYELGRDREAKVTLNRMRDLMESPGFATCPIPEIPRTSRTGHQIPVRDRAPLCCGCFAVIWGLVRF